MEYPLEYANRSMLTILLIIINRQNEYVCLLLVYLLL
jgi:hypothetical protein